MPESKIPTNDDLTQDVDSESTDSKSRREFIKKCGKFAAITTPVVAAMLLPTAEAVMTTTFA